jgi:hypothetical protein
MDTIVDLEELITPSDPDLVFLVLEGRFDAITSDQNARGA